MGKAIDEKLAELADTGRLRYHDQLLAQVPPSLVTLLNVPGIGPRTAGDLWRELGIATLAGPGAGRTRGAAADGQGHLRQDRAAHPRRASRTSRRGRRSRMHMAEARELADRLAMLIETYPGVRSVTPAGSVRRGRETVGDLDLLVETDRPADVLAAVRTMPAAERVVAGLRGGEHRVSVQLLRGPQADVMTYPPGRRRHVHGPLHGIGGPQRPAAGAGAGPRLEPVRAWLRAAGCLMARCSPVTGDAADVRTFATEAEVYDFLGLPFIEPELREDRGEIEAALAGRLPRLVDGRGPPG